MATYTLSYPGDTVQLLLDKINSLNYYTRPQVLELLEQYARMVEVQSIVASKQDRLVSGTNIKTVDGQSIVGGGNVDLSRFVTATANNLANYYLKSDVYTKAEVQQLISSSQGPQGLSGNLNWPTFEIDAAMHLQMKTDTASDADHFTIDDEGHLRLII